MQFPAELKNFWFDRDGFITTLLSRQKRNSSVKENGNIGDSMKILNNPKSLSIL